MFKGLKNVFVHLLWFPVFVSSDYVKNLFIINKEMHFIDFSYIEFLKVLPKNFLINTICLDKQLYTWISVNNSIQTTF